MRLSGSRVRSRRTLRATVRTLKWSSGRGPVLDSGCRLEAEVESSGRRWVEGERHTSLPSSRRTMLEEGSGGSRGRPGHPCGPSDLCPPPLLARATPGAGSSCWSLRRKLPGLGVLKHPEELGLASGNKSRYCPLSLPLPLGESAMGTLARKLGAA